MSIQFEFRAPEPQTPEQQLAQDISLVMQAAIEQYHAGEVADAEALFGAILESMPHHPDANYNLGVIKVQSSRAAEAVTHFEVALGNVPNNGQYWVAYINALFESDQIAAGWTAVEIAQQQGVRGPALDGLIAQLANPQTRLRTTPVAPTRTSQEINLVVGEATHAAEPVPEKAATLPKSIKYRQPAPSEINKHASLVQKGQLGEALAYARKLVKNYPQSGDCWRSLTISLHKDGQFQEVIQTAKTAIEYNPSDAICRLLLADTLRYTGALTEAEVQCRELVALVPDHAEAHRVLAVTLGSLGRRAEALASLLRSSELAPRAAAVHSSLGTLYLGMGAMAQAEKSLRTSLGIDPTDANTRSNLLFCLAHSRTIDKATLVKEHRTFGELHDVAAPAGGRRHGNNRNPDRTLRVGFISGDLCNHAVAYYLLPIVTHLSRDPSLSLHFYYNFGLEDHMTEQLRACADVWHRVDNMSDAALNKRIAADGIDVLIDLSGHTAHGRLLALAHRPAPVQASWIGYPGTTGMQAFDYYLSDGQVTPIAEFSDQFVEKLALLPSAATFMPPPNCPPVNALPALHKGYVTYGSFNRINKISAEVIALWSRVLRAQPSSRMVIGAIENKLDEETYVKWFEAEGIHAARITFCPRTTLPVYMQQHHQVDVCLDTFPYSGSTTTLNALWMGVPTVTMPGMSMASRCGACWLGHVSLDEYIAYDEEAFVRKSIELTSNLDALNELRIGMRERCNNSVPFHPEQVAGGLSIALRTMWQRWCADETPTAFEAVLPAEWCAPALAQEAI